MLKKNIRLKNVSIKNAVKVGKKLVPIASMAMSIIPGGGIVSKVLDSKVGKILTKVKSSKALKFATKIGKSKVGKFAINNLVKPTIKNAFAGNQLQPVYNEPQQIEASEPVEEMPNVTPTPAQLETIAEVKGVPAESLTTSTTETGEAVPNNAQLETISKVKDIPVQNLKEEAQVQKETAQLESGTISTDKTNYTIPIVIGVGAVGAILLVTSSKGN
ncbi:hypothetical protein [Flavobacterium sp. UBA7680]|uniref:hypothetical protein n=1 Tax=Flavobacterium sp. UBA7680 TaxID=1946559 RepID=UPI0025C26B95|nr:hypothetical protein [Flavobacterium sp. UBA7680]